MSLRQKLFYPGNVFFYLFSKCMCRSISFIQRDKLSLPFPHSIGDTINPIKWDQQMTPTKVTPVAEPKKISEIKDLNPFRYKVMLFLMFVFNHFISFA